MSRFLKKVVEKELWKTTFCSRAKKNEENIDMEVIIT